MSKIHLNELLPDNFNRVTKIYNPELRKCISSMNRNTRQLEMN